MNSEAFELREIGEADGPSLGWLEENCADGGTFASYFKYSVDPWAGLRALRPGTIGVLAEAKAGGVIGMALMTKGQCWLAGEERPFWYLLGLAVAPEWRNRGVGKALAQWWPRKARELTGERAVLLAGIQGGNLPSLRVNQTWSTQLVQDRTRMAFAAPSKKPPRAAGWKVRQAEDADWDVLARELNSFYSGYELRPTWTGAGLSSLDSGTPFGGKLRETPVVVDSSGTILAGCSVLHDHQIETAHLKKMPWFLRALNLILRLLPSDGIIRRAVVRDLWCRTPEAGVFLWNQVRWLVRGKATTISTFYDAQGPLAEIIPKAPFVPSGGGWLALAADKQLDLSKPLYLGM